MVDTWKERKAKGLKPPSVAVSATRLLIEGTPLEKVVEVDMVINDLKDGLNKQYG